MRAVAILALILVAGAGCGGGKKRSEHARFVEQADTVCGKWGQALRQIPQPPDPTAPVQVAPYLQRFVPLLRKQNAELGSLKPPAKDARNMDLFLQAQGAQASLAARAGAAAARGNQKRMQLELSRWQAAIGQGAQIGNALGFKVCTGTASANS
jgi:hypothetical protein